MTLVFFNGGIFKCRIDGILPHYRRAPTYPYKKHVWAYACIKRGPNVRALIAVPLAFIATFVGEGHPFRWSPRMEC